MHDQYFNTACTECTGVSTEGGMRQVLTTMSMIVLLGTKTTQFERGEISTTEGE